VIKRLRAILTGITSHNIKTLIIAYFAVFSHKLFELRKKKARSPFEIRAAFCPNLLTYSLTPWSRVLLEKLTGFQLIKKFPHFMEPKGSLPHSQLRANCIYPEPAHTPTSHFLKTHPNIIVPSTPGSSQWSLSLRFPHQNPTHASLFLNPRYMPRPSHSSPFHHPKIIG
jgi:hypothetical protein